MIDRQAITGEHVGRVVYVPVARDYIERCPSMFIEARIMTTDPLMIVASFGGSTMYFDPDVCVWNLPDGAQLATIAEG
jgi:hypothetical protein